MIDAITAALLIIGAFFMFVAGLGILRMPDIFLRMSCSTKAATIGFGTLLLALALYFRDTGVVTRSLATIAFVFATAPVASHRIGRVSYLVGVYLWGKTIRDELKNVYPPDACVPFGEVCAAPGSRSGKNISTD